MTFGPALSLGVSSLEEMVDVKITADLDAAAIAAALGEGTPDGLRFTGGVRLGPEDAGLTRVIDGARYALAFAKSALGDGRDAAWLAERAAELMAASERKVLRRIDGIGKWVDVRAFLRAIAVDTPESRAAIATAGMVGDLVTMLVDVEIRGSGAVKIAEVVEVLASEELPHRAVRVALGTWKADGTSAPQGAAWSTPGPVLLSPMDLAAVRRPRTVRATEPAEDVAPDAEEPPVAQAGT
jgi:hypothetical protein